MSNGPEPYSFIGRRAQGILNRDYNFDHKFTLSIPNPNGMGLTFTGFKKDQIFVGDISTHYKSGNAAIDVKVDTFSNVFTKVAVDKVLPGTKTVFSFKIPDHKSGKMDVEYCRDHAAINSSISLNPSPVLEIQAAIGTKDLNFGGEIGFDTASSSFTKYNTGISFNRPDFSAALILADKGQTLKASYVHCVTPSQRTTVAAEMTHKFSSDVNSFIVGSSHAIDAYSTVKTRFSNQGKVSMLLQQEWRPKSNATFSFEYDSKAKNSLPKFGLAIALIP